VHEVFHSLSHYPQNSHPACIAAHLRRNLHSEGISTRALQEILAHDRLATTEIYLNVSPEEVIREFYGKW
jgi:site-specific recombinase XerD